MTLTPLDVSSSTEMKRTNALSDKSICCVVIFQKN